MLVRRAGEQKLVQIVDLATNGVSPLLGFQQDASNMKLETRGASDFERNLSSRCSHSVSTQPRFLPVCIGVTNGYFGELLLRHLTFSMMILLEDKLHSGCCGVNY